MKVAIFLFILLTTFIISAQDSLYSKVYSFNWSVETYAADNTIDSGLVMVGSVLGQSTSLIIRLDSFDLRLYYNKKA